MADEITASSKTALDSTEVQSLRSKFYGALRSPDDESYADACNIWNGMIDKKPALIARCQGVADVMAALSFARERELLISVRGGGHNIAGTALCDDGVVIDLSQMKGIHIDAVKRRALVQPGVTWGQLDRETQVFGLAVPGGIVSSTGVAGLTLGGGNGWLARKYGLSCDNLLSADVLLAEGRLVTASTEQNADLFWGIRGRGGNFGIVTSFEYRLHPLGPEVMAGLVFYPQEKAQEVLNFYRDFAAKAPNELVTMSLLRKAPTADFLPKAIHGQPVVGIALCYAGSLEEAEKVILPLKTLGTPLVDLIKPMPFTDFQKMFDGGQPSGRHYYWKSEYLADISDNVIDASIAQAKQMTSPFSQVVFFQLSGAIAQRDEADTAATYREAAFIHIIAASWEDPRESDKHIQWTRKLWSEISPPSSGAGYANFHTQDEGEDRVRASYSSNYERLVVLKDNYDPDNLFRVNQNIKPSQG